MKNNIFKYPDTNSARAKIEALNNKFEDLKIGIIGLGGTGAYILDLISKTPVAEIHLYDGDVFQLHNAFRAPGATPATKFSANRSLYKVDYLKTIYDEMHSKIMAYKMFINNENINELKKLDFIFISVDNSKGRYMIASGLLLLNIPFIDVGLGVNEVENELIGTVRVTVGSPQKNDHLENRIGSEELDGNEYATNIQIADLNCLNAALAVIGWKKYVGFYQDLKKEHNQLYFINTSKILNEDFKA